MNQIHYSPFLNKADKMIYYFKINNINKKWINIANRYKKLKKGL